ncbi:hypothetical protein ScalyP_jg4739 [Parmales sp. scaly parma]|nr:hypothetical protein ScalyP_jg4739 [Parmales sp. scaly parma]
MITPRAFNEIKVLDSIVVKSGPYLSILSERSFYATTAPTSLSVLFPQLVDEDDVDCDSLVNSFRSSSSSSSSSTHSMSIEFVEGPTFSHLVRENKLNSHLEKLLKALLKIHTNKEISLVINLDEQSTWLEQKVAKRFANFRAVYDEVAASTVVETTYAKLMNLLSDYHKNNHFRIVSVIHGDPVFTNVILDSKSNEIKLIDPRGLVGAKISTNGDLIYDLSKVYQSLLGYDFIIADFDNSDGHGSLAEHIEFFWEFVLSKYGGETIISDIKILTASHFFSIIPLHENTHHRTAFFAKCCQVLNDV